MRRVTIDYEGTRTVRSISSFTLAVLAIALVSPLTHAAQVTYHFTGQVIGSFGALPNVPSSVTGDLTFDLDVFDALKGTSDRNTGDASHDYYWDRTQDGVVGQALVTESLTFNNTTYDSVPSGPEISSVGMIGSRTSALLLVNAGISQPGQPWMSLSNIFRASAGYTPYLSNGLLNLDVLDLDSSAGYFEMGGGVGPGYGRFVFRYTSFVAVSALPAGGVPVLVGQPPPVPVPAAIWLFVSGLGFLGAYRKRA